MFKKQRKNGKEKMRILTHNNNNNLISNKTNYLKFQIIIKIIIIELIFNIVIIKLKQK